MILLRCLGTEKFQYMGNGGQLGPRKRVRLDKWTSRDNLQYWDEKGRIDGDIPPTSELPVLTKWCPGRCLPSRLASCLWGLRNGRKCKVGSLRLSIWGMGLMSS